MAQVDYLPDYDRYDDYLGNRGVRSYPSGLSKSLDDMGEIPRWSYRHRERHRWDRCQLPPYGLTSHSRDTTENSYFPPQGYSGNITRRAADHAHDQTGKKTVKRRVRKKVAEFADLTTVAGLAWIKNATSWAARLFWIVAFLAMFAVLVWHLYSIFHRYYSYPFTTKISIKSDELAPFPSVTLCNLNPIRSTELYRDPGLEEFVQEVQAVYEVNITDTRRSPDDGDPDADDPGDPVTEYVRRKRQADADKGEDEDEDYSPYYDYGGGNYFDDFVDNYTDYYDDGYYDDDDGGAVFGGTTDASIIVDRMFKSLVGKIEPITRKMMGHQRSLMILKCTFNGKTCFASNFTHSFSESYGNCYTFNSASNSNSSYITRFVGPNNGLSLQLYVEDTNYLQGFTQGQGFRVVIHQFGALPFPEELGYSIPAGMETFVGLRRKKYVRLGEPYEKCEDGKAFKNKYNAKYTKKSCTALCNDALTAKNCSCYVGQRIEYYSASDIAKLPRCDGEGSTCAAKITNAVLVGNASCDCYRACSTTRYTRQISSNVWPDQGVYNVLGTLLCNKENFGVLCEGMKEGVDASVEDKSFYLRNDFAKLNVFFNELTYEDVAEEADYPLSNFAADIGGVIGLWLGLSVFSIVEIVMLITTICKMLAPKKDTSAHSRGQPPRKVYPSPVMPRFSSPALAYNHSNWDRDTEDFDSDTWKERF